MRPSAAFPGTHGEFTHIVVIERLDMAAVGPLNLAAASGGAGKAGPAAIYLDSLDLEGGPFDELAFLALALG